MTKVSPEDSALLTMFYAEECSLATIGGRLGVAEGTAKVRLFRARAALKKQVEALHQRGAA
jgi:DNA-directed RNA polymerase specialized sigma24 family protein